MPSYEKRGNQWCVRFRSFEDGIEKNKRLTAPTKREAREAYEEYIKSYEYHPVTEEPVVTFADLFERYMEHEKTRIKDTSYYDIRNKIENRIIPSIGDIPVKSLSPADIDKWMTTVSSYSFSYRLSLWGHLRAVLRYGQRYHDLPNISDRVDPPRNTEKPTEINYWTPEQFKAFISASDDPLFARYFRFLYVSGCRRGEAEALSPSDISPSGTVTISKSITHKISEKNGIGWKITTPKNRSSIRTIQIPPRLARELLTMAAPGATFVFSLTGQNPLAENSIRYHLDKWSEAAGLPRIRVHDFRHSCASMLLSSGVPITAVAKHLGHSDIKETLNTYSHMMPRDEDLIAKALKHI